MHLYFLYIYFSSLPFLTGSQCCVLPSWVLENEKSRGVFLLFFDKA